uniref:Secretory peptide n=1 Tax=Steinernema glaseri TaxID=37863 RepID=A0A1I7YH44_9BILA
MKSALLLLVFVLVSLLVLEVSADIRFRDFESAEFDRPIIRAYRIKRDWSDRTAQATGWSAWKCFHGYDFPNCLS